MAGSFASVVAGYFAGQHERLLALVEEESAGGVLDRLVAGDGLAVAVDAIATAQIHGAGFALRHAREDLGALRLAALGDWQAARRPSSAIDFWAAELGVSTDVFRTITDAARRIASAAVALSMGPLLTDLHETLERGQVAELSKVYEAHGLLPGAAHRAELVVANNVQQAAHAVRFQQTVGNPAAGRLIPYLFWWTLDDGRVRERPLHNHAVMHYRVFSIDHPIWKSWWPPAGHNCRCGIGTLTADEARELGYVGSEPTGPWPTAPGTGGLALPDPGFQGALDLPTAAEDLVAQTRRIFRDAQVEGGDLFAAISRLFTALGLSPEVS